MQKHQAALVHSPDMGMGAVLLPPAPCLGEGHVLPLWQLCRTQDVTAM